jgi:hypothetical protein
MFQFQQLLRQPRQRRSGAADASWLSALVARFELISRADVRAAPCEEPLLRAAKAHLARPVSSQVVPDHASACSNEQDGSGPRPAGPIHSPAS